MIVRGKFRHELKTKGNYNQQNILPSFIPESDSHFTIELEFENTDVFVSKHCNTADKIK